MKQLRLTIDSNLEHVSLIGLAINKLCEHFGHDEILACQVELCAVEALTNAIRHGYRNQPGQEVTVILSVDADRFAMEVCDRGEPIAPEFVDQLQNGSHVFDFDPTSLDTVPEGGMGLEIMHQVMDEVSYTRGSAAGDINRLCLTKMLTPSKSQPF